PGGGGGRLRLPLGRRPQLSRRARVAPCVPPAARFVLALVLLVGSAGSAPVPAHAQDDEGYVDDQGYDDGGQYAAPDPSSYGEPLPPFATQVIVIDEFVFVHEGDFCSRDLVHAVVNHHLVPDHVIHRWQHRDWRNGHPPHRHHIEQVSHHPVTRMDRRPPGTLA